VPSPAHQALLLWAARKMARDGFEITAYDGNSMQGGAWNSLSAPPIILGVRPDGVGVHGACYAFAEAKTAGDINTPHTRAQLRVLAGVVGDPPSMACRLYLAVPRSAAAALDRVLIGSGLAAARRVVRVHVPDILLRGAA
jgi:hypothetical protein